MELIIQCLETTNLVDETRIERERYKPCLGYKAGHRISAACPLGDRLLTCFEDCRGKSGPRQNRKPANKNNNRKQNPRVTH